MTFQIDESTLSNPASEIQDVFWVISRNGLPASASDYDLDTTVGSNLADWTTETSLSFAPATEGVFEVSGEVVWGSISQNLEPASLEVGAAPEVPIRNIPETAFCDLGGQLDVTSSVLTPNGLLTNLCATVLDKATDEPLSLPGVGCVTSGADPNQVSLICGQHPQCGLPARIGSDQPMWGDFHRGGHQRASTPNFSLSLTPFCEADSEAVILSNFELTFTNCDNDAPVMTETWTLEEDTIEVATANAFPLPDSLGYVNGDVVCQTIDLAYPMEAGDTLHCVAQACEDILYFEAAAIEWQVTYPVTWPPVCSGDSIEIEIIAPPARSSHVWDTFPLPDSTSSNGASPADCIGNLSSNNVANYFALDTNGVTGIIRRTTCHQGPDLSTATCVTDTVFEIDVAPKPSIAWVDSISSVTACAYETSRALANVVDSEEV